jgi:hypothetical protein
MDFADVFSESEGAMSEPSLPELPELHEMFDFDGASLVSVRSQSAVASQHNLPPSVPPSLDGSESRVPWASAAVEDVPSDDEDGLFDDGLDSASDDELEDAVSTSAEPPKWKIHHSRGDHRLNGTCTPTAVTELTIPSARLHCADAVGELRRHAGP